MSTFHEHPLITKVKQDPSVLDSDVLTQIAELVVHGKEKQLLKELLPLLNSAALNTDTSLKYTLPELLIYKNDHLQLTGEEFFSVFKKADLNKTNPYFNKVTYKKPLIWTILDNLNLKNLNLTNEHMLTLFERVDFTQKLGKSNVGVVILNYIEKDPHDLLGIYNNHLHFDKNTLLSIISKCDFSTINPSEQFSLMINTLAKKNTLLKNTFYLSDIEGILAEHYQQGKLNHNEVVDNLIYFYMVDRNHVSKISKQDSQIFMKYNVGHYFNEFLLKYENALPPEKIEPFRQAMEVVSLHSAVPELPSKKIKSL